MGFGEFTISLQPGCLSQSQSSSTELRVSIPITGVIFPQSLPINGSHESLTFQANKGRVCGLEHDI